MKTQAEIYQETIAALSISERRAIFPPMTKKNFVVRKSWYGRGQIISFMPKASKTNPKPQLVTYNHDVVFDIMEPFLKHKAAWAKYGYWSQSTNMPTLVRHRDLLTEDDKKFLKPTKAKK